MESSLSTCDSLFHQPKPDRKKNKRKKKERKNERKKEKSNACVFSLPLSGSVSLSVGEAAFLQGALTTSVGLPLSASSFPVETAGDLVPDSRKKKLGG